MVVVSRTGGYFGHVASKEAAMAIDSVAKGKNLSLITDAEWEANKNNREARGTVFAEMGEKLN